MEYSSPAGYQAAAAANPHKLDGESFIYVEARRPKAAAYGGTGYNGAGRGGMNGRGRGNFDGRPGSQGGRGSFAGRGRGGAGAARGARGGAAPAAA